MDTVEDMGLRAETTPIQEPCSFHAGIEQVSKHTVSDPQAAMGCTALLRFCSTLILHPASSTLLVAPC